MFSKLEIVKFLEKKAFKLLRQGLENEDVLKKFEEVSLYACTFNDVFIAYAYAERFSQFCYGNEKFMKALHINDLQNIVMKSGDEEYMFEFGTRVCGANTKSLIDAMPNGLLKNKLKKENQPIGECCFK